VICLQSDDERATADRQAQRLHSIARRAPHVPMSNVSAAPNASAVAPSDRWGCSLGLYVHLPFCLEHCPYCDFFTVPETAPAFSLQRVYLDSLNREFDIAIGRFPNLREFALNSVYLGGGTPSLHSADSLAPLIERINRVWGGDALRRAEVTIEANPGSLTRDSLRDYVELGVNRVSLGVQTLNDPMLKELGRRHDAAQAREAIGWLRGQSGLRSFSCDLIFGLPGQRMEHVLDDIDGLAELGAPHLSIYGLTLHEGTVFERRYRNGDLPLPDEDTTLAMFRQTHERTAHHGFAAYEISSFGRPGHRSRHNSSYWNLAPILPLGVSACGYLAGQRVENPKSLPKYLEASRAQDLAWVWEERLTGRHAAAEAILCGLRQIDGITWDWLARHTDVDPRHEFAEQIRDALAAEWLDQSFFARPDGGLRFTRAGLELSDSFFVSLF